MSLGPSGPSLQACSARAALTSDLFEADAIQAVTEDLILIVY